MVHFNMSSGPRHLSGAACLLFLPHLKQQSGKGWGRFLIFSSVWVMEHWVFVELAEAKRSLFLRKHVQSFLSWHLYQQKFPFWRIWNINGEWNLEMASTLWGFPKWLFELCIWDGLPALWVNWRWMDGEGESERACYDHQPLKEILSVFSLQTPLVSLVSCTLNSVEKINCLRPPKGTTLVCHL